MRNKDTGEFELVVGNKQLLTGFFIGMLLLGVVFAMGYVLGQNTPKSAKVAAESPTPGLPTPIPTETRQPAAASTPVLTPPDQVSAALNPDGDEKSSTPAEAAPQPTTVPAQTAAQAPGAEPANATYWQVMASSSDASAMKTAELLRSQGFPVSTRPGPNNLTLVWVGPYTDRDSLVEAKRKLGEIGMKDIRQKKP